MKFESIKDLRVKRILRIEKQQRIDTVIKQEISKGLQVEIRKFIRKRFIYVATPTHPAMSSILRSMYEKSLNPLHGSTHWPEIQKLQQQNKIYV